MSDELCDQENERHALTLRGYRGFPGSRSLPEHERPTQGRTFMDGHDPDQYIEDLLSAGYIEVDTDGRPIEHMRFILGRLFVRLAG